MIVPQTLTVGTSFIEITLPSGTAFTYKLASAIIFESGKKYKYDITVNQTGLTVSSTIADWDAVNSGTPVAGEANME